MILWSGTLGSNLTIAGAPALYVALRLAEKEEDARSRSREFLSWSMPFTIVASVICYVFGMLIWVLPYARLCQAAQPRRPASLRWRHISIPTDGISRNRKRRRR